MRTNPGFTILELMVTVGILFVLAAIAVPSFLAGQERARAAEMVRSGSANHDAELAYDAVFDGYASAERAPRILAGDRRRPREPPTGFSPLSADAHPMLPSPAGGSHAAGAPRL